MLALRWLTDRCLARRRVSKPSRRDCELVRGIRESASDVRQLSDRELRGQVDLLREALAVGRSADAAEILVSGFSLVNEAARRTIGITYYDVQLLAGLALARGAVAEMQTGEGKTFVAALPAVVRALTGRGVHVVTSNAYLAGRDFQLLAPAYECLGISVGLLRENAGHEEKRKAYGCEITYGTGYEFGFDYLRDQVALRQTETCRLGDKLLGQLRGRSADGSRTVQRGLPFAIIDEVDHVLIDDASSPLVLSGSATTTAEDSQAHLVARHMIASLTERSDYELDAASRAVRLTAAGSRRIHADPDAIPLEVLLRPWSEYVEQALRAQTSYLRDVHYVVQDGRVRIVDESTGRIFSDRNWRQGLHQAIEAKENVAINSEKQPLARITRQRFFRLYECLCGMTGTATGSHREFWAFYRLPTVVIPLRKPCRRKVLPTRYFADPESKWSAISDELERVHRSGRPVLVGTRTIAASESLARRLDSKRLPYRILNGKQDADEAAVIARAGQAGSITIATNMAGRGTDVKLSAEVADGGGLHVMATERNESRRIDRQLVGRSARQGDPGSVQFFLSADDILIETHAPWLGRGMKRTADRNGEIMIDLGRNVRGIQHHAEREGFSRRRQLFHYDKHRDGVIEKSAPEG